RIAWECFWLVELFFCLVGVMDRAESKSFRVQRANRARVSPIKCGGSEGLSCNRPRTAGETPAGQQPTRQRYFEVAPSKWASISSSVFPFVSGRNHVAVTK